MSHGLGQNFDGGAGSRCPAVFSTGYGAHQGKKPGVLGAHAFIVLGTVPIKSKDPGAQQYLVLGTVPIKRKNWGFGCPCIFCTRYRAHHVKTSPAGSCSIFPQSTWAPCPKRWDFLCIQVTGCCVPDPNGANHW